VTENRKTGIFYGWFIVGASFFISILLGGVVLYGFTAIFEPVSREQNWSYTQVSLASSIRSVEAGLLAPLTGWMVDKLGPRRMIFAGGLIVALGLFVVSRATSLAMFYGGFALIAIGNDCCGMTVMVTAVTHWFKRKLGLASGLTVAGYGFGGLVIPIMVVLIDKFGWRGAVSILAVAVVVVVVPLSLLFRHKPEKYGLVPDGKEMPVTEKRADRPVEDLPDVNFSFKQALKTRSFWLLVIAFAGQNIALQAVVVHVMPYSTSIGIDRATASIIATMIPVTSIFGRVSFGWLGDKVKRQWIVIGAFALTSVGLLSFASISGVSCPLSHLLWHRLRRG
jgi:sugar phosphate permease